MSFVFDGLYPVAHIKAALKQAFGDRRILDYSYATSIGARVGLLAATVREPSICVFTNYNGVGTRDLDQGKPKRFLKLANLTSEVYHVICPSDGYGNVPLWEV